MRYNKKTVRDIDVRGKRVLLRCDFNVPQDKTTLAVTDDSRITAALPTVRYLLENGAAVIACSHLGRPKGKVKPEFSLAPVAKRLSELLGQNVALAPDVAGPESKKMAAALKPGELMLLENLRFRPEEELNDPVFARELASLADIYVSDAFGTVHRAHASTEGVAHCLPAVSGFLLAAELSALGKAMDDPPRPFVAIVGGSKVSDKLGLLIHLIDLADTVLVGGGMAYTFLRAMGRKTGNSLCEEEMLPRAVETLRRAKERGVSLLLPVDSIAASALSPDAEPVSVGEDIPDGLMGLDIGPMTREIFAGSIKTAGTVVWNGPVGVFEYPAFASGTLAVAKAMAESGAVTVIGGGDSAAAVKKFGLESSMSHISTGGGASLEFMEGVELPGVRCLMNA